MKIESISLCILTSSLLGVEKPIVEQSITRTRNQCIRNRLNNFVKHIHLHHIKSECGFASIIKGLASSTALPSEDPETMALATTWYTTLMQNQEIRQKKESFELYCKNPAIYKDDTLKQTLTREYVQVTALQLANLLKEACPTFQLPPEAQSATYYPDNLIDLLRLNIHLTKETALRPIAATIVVTSMLENPD